MLLLGLTGLGHRSSLACLTGVALLLRSAKLGVRSRHRDLEEPTKGSIALRSESHGTRKVRVGILHKGYEQYQAVKNSFEDAPQGTFRVKHSMRCSMHCDASQPPASLLFP